MRENESDKSARKDEPKDRCFGLLDVDERTAKELIAQCPVAFRELGK